MNFNKFIGKGAIKARCIRKVPEFLTVGEYYPLLISSVKTRILKTEKVVENVSCSTEFLGEYFVLDNPKLSPNIRVL